MSTYVTRSFYRKNISAVIWWTVFCALFVAFVFCQNAYASSKNFLWEVRSGTGMVYVLGSLHFFKPELYPLHERIESAFDRSDILVVEANINDILKIDIGSLVKKAFYAEHDTLADHLSEKTYNLVISEAGRLGLPIELVAKQKPWFLALTLSAMELMRLGFHPDSGIDVHFLSKAQGNKEILELESVDYQIDLLSGFSDKEQEMFLYATLKDITMMREQMDVLLEAWRSGDAAGIQSMLEKSRGDDAAMIAIAEKMFYTRNRNMTATIEKFLSTEKTYFVVVGAGHLVGRDGVVDMLKTRGYRVRQL